MSTNMSMNSTYFTGSTNNRYAILTAFVHGFVAIFGTITNAVVILTYIKWRRTMFEMPRDLLIFTLALGDCITSLFVAPIGLAASVAGRWSSGRAGCIWYGFISTWTGLSSILQLTGIAGERYFTLAHPDLRWSGMCKKYARLFIVLAWLVSGLASTFPLFGWSKYDLEGIGLHCSIVWSASTLNYGSYCLFLLVFFFVVPLGLLMYFYTNVYFVVRQLSNGAESLWGANDLATRQTYTAQVKVVRQLVFLTGMFLFAWTPYAVTSFISVANIFKPSKETSTLPALFAKMSYVYNPLVYFFTFKRLRRQSAQLFKLSTENPA